MKRVGELVHFRDKNERLIEVNMVRAWKVLRKCQNAIDFFDMVCYNEYKLNQKR